jgi:hypothetical protein
MIHEFGMHKASVRQILTVSLKVKKFGLRWCNASPRNAASVRQFWKKKEMKEILLFANLPSSSFLAPYNVFVSSRLYELR